MNLSKEALKLYDDSRYNTDKSIVCHAPFVNLNFEQNGNVRACCYNTIHILGKWPNQTIKEIWEGEKANELRTHIHENNLGGGCIECGKMIAARNYQGVRARYYDEFSPNLPHDRVKRFVRKIVKSKTYPKVMEFELSNECNLECVMCNGHFSSSIRKNREKLQPILSPYNDQFVDELEDFIPYLTDAKFLGGEPFMIDIYLKIWEKIKKINPHIRIHITTNGTFLNNRIKDLLESLQAGIILSIDSVNKSTYQKIRVNGNFDKVMENLNYFLDYTKRKRTFISIAACPIVHNWMELPEMLEFCLEKNIALYFNAVFTPLELSLREQTLEKQREILRYLKSYQLPSEATLNTNPRQLSMKAYTDFLNQLKGWLEEKELLAITKAKLASDSANSRKFNVVHKIEVKWSTKGISEAIMEINKLDGRGNFERENEMKAYLGNLLVETPEGKLYDSLTSYFSKTTAEGESIDKLLAEKLWQFSNLIDSHSKRNQILFHLSSLSPVFFANWIKENSFEEMRDNLLIFFN